MEANHSQENFFIQKLNIGVFMTTAVVMQVKVCPNCGAEMPAYRDYVSWCEKCNYGIEGEQKEQKKKNRLEKLYDELGKKQSQEIFKTIAKEKSLQPGLSKTRIAIFVIAGLVHLVSLSMLFLGLTLLITRWQYFILAVFGFILLGLAWILRPRPTPQPKENVLARAEFPALYQLVDQVAKSLGTHIDQLVINEEFNAGYMQTGWRQKHTIAIGLPLWTVLNDQERLALIAHEMAHAVNGDASRGLLVGSALQSLVRWYQVIAPGQFFGDGQTILHDLLSIPYKILAAVFAGIIWALIRLLSILLFRDMQRAEYLADRLGANVSGCDAFINMLHKMFFKDAFILAVQHVALNSQKPDFYQEFQDLIDSTPRIEYERLRRLGDQNMTRLDITHPPTGLRIKMLQDYALQGPIIQADDETMRAIDQQLNRFKPKVQAKLVDQYRAAIF